MISRKPLGVVLFEGPSRIDGSPIVVVATISSRNEKTGDMIQTWIMRQDINPIEAINTGDDVSICGGCPLRGIVERTGDDTRNRMRGCYVKVSNAPRAVFDAYRRGVYPAFDPSKHAKYFESRKLRMGAYGDPVAAPLSIWKPLMRLSSGWTGYTHQWRNRRFRRWARYVMASTHTLAENDLASSYGFRTFRSRLEGSPVADNEIV